MALEWHSECFAAASRSTHSPRSLVLERTAGDVPTVQSTIDRNFLHDRRRRSVRGNVPIPKSASRKNTLMFSAVRHFQSYANSRRQIIVFLVLGLGDVSEDARRRMNVVARQINLQLPSATDVASTTLDRQRSRVD